MPPAVGCGVEGGGGGGEGGVVASFSPWGAKTLKSDWLTVATSACARIAVAAIRQSNREPRRRPVLLNNSATRAASGGPKGIIRDCKTAFALLISDGVIGPFRNSVHAIALAANESPAASQPSTS